MCTCLSVIRIREKKGVYGKNFFWDVGVWVLHDRDRDGNGETELEILGLIGG
jgi:hypothetical protein